MRMFVVPLVVGGGNIPTVGNIIYKSRSLGGTSMNICIYILCIFLIYIYICIFGIV